MESHYPPWAFDDHCCVRERSCYAVIIVESGSFGEVGRKLIFPIALYYCRVQPSGQVADGMTVYIMQPYSNGVSQEAFAVIGADLKASGCYGGDTFLLQPWGRVIEW